jgi:UDP-N-acetylmuramoyl-L-alanyl-D-glutamate--2,6-diaminopimelate ligase
MQFSDMIKVIQDQIIESPKIPDFDPHNLCYDSRAVESGDVFFAIKGYKSDGNLFINSAFQKGALAVVTDSENVITDSRILRVKDVRKAMALMSGRFYDFPSSKMKIIGVTGTNGKTTVSSLIYHILASSGKKCGLIGTNGNLINNRFIKTSHTTPESVELQKLLKDMADENVEFVSMEVSSHSLSLSRVYGIDFDIAVFTNLSIDHLDFHGDMDNYFSAKKKLFDSLKRINTKGNKTSVIYNSDDSYGDKIVTATEAERVSYGITGGSYKCEDVDMNFRGSSFRMFVPRNGDRTSEIKIKTNLTGRFNVYNVIASAAAVRSLGLKWEQIADAIKSFVPVEGRFNQLTLNNGAIAIVDYSHTPDSLLNALKTIRGILESIKSRGRIITVFGCGGNRDKTKRPLMGDVAVKHSDIAIITSDNPRDEDPTEIINEIKAGVKSDNYSIIENREQAIKRALELSNKNDVVLIAGKGHETYQEIKGTKYHFSDKEVIEKYM